jgi:hypothetical protein
VIRMVFACRIRSGRSSQGAAVEVNPVVPEDYVSGFVWRGHG